MKNDKYRLIMGSIASIASAIYFFYQGINFGVTSTDEILKINTKITQVIEKPNGRRQTQHYIFYSSDYNNEFFVYPDYTHLLNIEYLENQLIKNPNLTFEIGIDKSSIIKLNKNIRINIYSIETNNDYFLNPNLVVIKNKRLRILQIIFGFIFLLAGIYCYIRYKLYG